MSERVVMCAAKLYDARSSLRGILGDEYDERVEPFRTIIRKLSENRPPIEVMIEMLKKLDRRGANGWDQMFVMAAAVDVTETSNNPAPDDPESPKTR